MRLIIIPCVWLVLLTTGCASVSTFDVGPDDTLTTSRIEEDFSNGDSQVLLKGSATWNEVFDLHFEPDSVEIEAKSKARIGNQPVIFKDRARRRFRIDELSQIRMVTGKGSGFRLGFRYGSVLGFGTGLAFARALDEDSFWDVTPVGYVVIAATSAALFGLVLGGFGELFNIGHREKTVYRFAR